jgi:hypothetical protein
MSGMYRYKGTISVLQTIYHVKLLLHRAFCYDYLFYYVIVAPCILLRLFLLFQLKHIFTHFKTCPLQVFKLFLSNNNNNNNNIY